MAAYTYDKGVMFRMWLTTTVGTGMILSSVVSALRQRNKDVRRVRKEVQDVVDLLKIQTELKELNVKHMAYVGKVQKEIYGFSCTVALPKGYPVSKFRNHVETIEEATASKIKVKHLGGTDVELKLGMVPLLEYMGFNQNLIRPGELKIPYYTPFGVQYLDFWNESTYHLIIAGATRMGKSVFLRLLFTSLILATSGKIQFFYINNKIEDGYPMQGLPQIPPPAESIADAFETLTKVRAELEDRKLRLRSAKDSVNIKQYREKHPEDPIYPMFVVFDEYGRFAEDEDIQELVTELTETAGSYDVHVVIATQRPDATTVLKPRIRANILTRVCFQTADEANSKIVVHTEDAAHLDEIRGRAIVLDGMPTIGQTPFISEEQTQELLWAYRRNDDVDQERPASLEVSQTLPSFVTQTLGEDSLPRCEETVCDSESDYATPESGRTRNSRTKTQRRVLPLHAKPDPDTH